MEIELVNHYKETNMRVMLASLFERLPHTHHDIEILMPIQGAIYMAARSKTYYIKKDEFFLLSHDVIHSGFQTNEPNLFVALEVSPNFCKRFFPRLTRMNILENHVTPTSNPELYSCLRKAVVEAVSYCGQEPNGSELLITSSLCMLIVGILNYANYEEYSEKEYSSHMSDYRRIMDIVNYINENYTSKISLNSLAEKQNLNPSYLSRIISEQLGISFRDYVNNLRIAKAAQLLSSTDMSKLDICFASGFSDYRYLSNGIKKVYGCSPDELRNRLNSPPPSPRDNSFYQKQHHIVDISDAHKTLSNYFKKDMHLITTV